MKKKRIIIIGVILILIAILFWLYFYLSGNRDYEITLASRLSAEVGSKVKTLDFIKKIEGGDITSKNIELDTSKIGTLEVCVDVKVKKKAEEYCYDLKIVDTTAPVISGVKDLNTKVGTKIDLLENIEVTDNSGEEIEVKIIGEYDFSSVGATELKYEATDSSGNTASEIFVLNVERASSSGLPAYNNSQPLRNETITTSKGYTLVIKDGVASIDGIIIVNKSYPLPSTYGGGLTDETVQAYYALQNAALKEGLKIYNSSGYRSYIDQKITYEGYVARDGVANADRYSARPGHSEHQSGLAMDINQTLSTFAETPEGIFLNENAHKYGFIIRYPKEKEHITGYMYEPWHIRYVGTELAAQLYNNGDWITLEEHFGIDSKYSS